MISVLRHAGAILAASAFLVLAVQAQAQEVPESHLKAARAAIAAIHATDSYDNILPAAAQALKQELIQQNPDLQELIISTVDEKTILLASRRTDLEREAALVYARSFSEADLTAIAAFYTSDAGRKLLSDGPIAAREVVKAADIWRNGIARDLAQDVGKTLEDTVNARRAADPAAAPTPAEAPAQ